MNITPSRRGTYLAYRPRFQRLRGVMLERALSRIIGVDSESGWQASDINATRVAWRNQTSMNDNNKQAPDRRGGLNRQW